MALPQLSEATVSHDLQTIYLHDVKENPMCLDECYVLIWWCIQHTPHCWKCNKDILVASFRDCFQYIFTYLNQNVEHFLEGIGNLCYVCDQTHIFIYLEQPLNPWKSWACQLRTIWLKIRCDPFEASPSTLGVERRSGESIPTHPRFL